MRVRLRRTRTVRPATADDESETGMTATQTDPPTTEDDMSDPVTDNIAKLTKLSQKMDLLMSKFGCLSQEFDNVKREFSTGQVSRQLAEFDRTIKALTTMIQSVAETRTQTEHQTPDSDHDKDDDGDVTDRNGDEFEWLVIDKSGTPELAKCSTCTKFGGKAGAKSELWVTKGVVLGRYRRQKLLKHAQSQRHREAAELQAATKSTPSIDTVTQATTKKATKLTEQNMTIAYHGVLRSHSYEDHAQEHLLLNTLGFDVGNQHQTGRAAAQAVDTIYEVFTDEVARHLDTPNPATGRRRHIHLSLDKFTESKNQRQAVNLRVLDTDGCPVVVHGTTGAIRTYDDPVPEYTAQTTSSSSQTHQADGRGVTCHAAGCLKEDLKLTDQNISVQVTSSSTDCEAVYAGKSNGFRRIWQERFNAGLIHLDDRDHRLETLLAKAMKGDDMAWMEGYIEDLRQVIGLFLGSPLLRLHSSKRSRHLCSVSLRRASLSTWSPL